MSDSSLPWHFGESSKLWRVGLSWSKLFSLPESQHGVSSVQYSSGYTRSCVTILTWYHTPYLSLLYQLILKNMVFEFKNCKSRLCVRELLLSTWAWSLTLVLLFFFYTIETFPTSHDRSILMMRTEEVRHYLGTPSLHLQATDIHRERECLIIR